MQLTDPIWKELAAGYRVPYDVSVPLRKLEQADDPEIVEGILEELWNELHHQGDVGLASYLAVPQLVRIGKSKAIVNTDLLGLCCVIEQQRHAENNPCLPAAFEDYYQNGLKALKLLALDYLQRDLDETTLVTALATIATCSGNIKIGKAIFELDDPDILDEFLTQF